MRALSLSLVLMLLVEALLPSGSRAIEVVDPFQPYLTDKPPDIARKLGEETIGNVRLQRLVFLSRTIRTPQRAQQKSEVFALVARPNAAGSFPGLLILHGGRGAAEQAKAIAWAARGYVVVAPDLPGIADPQAIPYSSGPWKGDFSSRYITARPDVTASPIFDGVLAAVQALYLLRSQPDVIKERVGVVGVSWGGYAATMVCGLTGNAVRAAFSVYGSGYYDKGSAWQERLTSLPKTEAEAWLRHLDAGRRVEGIIASYFIAAATNDSYYWPPAVMATLEAIRGEKNQLFAPNAVRSAPVPGGTRPPNVPSSTWLDMEVAYFDFYLKDKGQPFPVITIEGMPFQASPARGGMRVRFRVRSEIRFRRPLVYYSTVEKPWTARKWVRVAAAPLGSKLYEAVIPAAATAQGADWFALVSDTRPVSVSSGIARVRAP